MPFLFCNVGWMERYEGLGASGDRIQGGGKYVIDNKFGHEVFNFSEFYRTMYGFVQVNGKQIDIDRLGANPRDDSITGVTVIWTATRPTGGTAVIGWYRDATIYRSLQHFTEPALKAARQGIDGYWIKAPASQAKRLTVTGRALEIPRQTKGGMGQSNVWYADSSESEELVKQVQMLVEGTNPLAESPRRAQSATDQERKARVERAAIRHSCDYFEMLGYAVVSVEKDNVGWDLEASSGRTKLRIEVKGLSGPVFSVQLTPNEYNAFTRQEADYRLAVVTNALENPTLSICRFSGEQGAWLVEGQSSGRIEIKIRQSASVEFVTACDSSSREAASSVERAAQKLNDFPSLEPSPDHIIRDLHRIREAIVDSFGGDLHALAADAQRRLEASGQPIWRRKLPDKLAQISSETSGC